MATGVRTDLGRWLGKRLKAIALREWNAKAEINTSGFTAEYLREQWELQRAAQLSLRRRTFSLTSQPHLTTSQTPPRACARNWRR